MLYSAFSDKVLDAIGDSSLSGRVPDWYNDTCDEVEEDTIWRFRKKHVILPTTAPYSTGTVAVTNGSTTVTGSGTAWTSDMIGQIFKGPDSKNYIISAVGSTTELTLSSNYIGTTVASGGSYTVYYYRLTPPTDLDAPRITSMVLQGGAGSHERVRYITENHLLDISANPAWMTGEPTHYRFDEGYLFLHPAPDLAYNLDLRYYRTYTAVDRDTPSASQDLSTDWPKQLLSIIAAGTIAKGLAETDDTRAPKKEAKFYKRLEAQKEKNNKQPDVVLDMRPLDEPGASLGDGYLPSVIGE